jgi:hypothetical protein
MEDTSLQLLKVVVDGSIIYERMRTLPSNVNRSSRFAHGKPPEKEACFCFEPGGAVANDWHGNLGGRCSPRRFGAI